MDLAEATQIALHSSRSDVAWTYQEQNIVAKRTAARRRSMSVAGLVTILALAGGTAVWFAVKKG